MKGDNLKTEQGISECYLEGVLKHSGSISGFIYIVTQLVKNSEGDGSLIINDVDEALARMLGELSSVTLDPMRTKRGSETSSELPELDFMNQLYWLGNEMTYPSGARELRKDITPVPPVEEVIAQVAESLADPNFFIAEISGIISALVELKSVCDRRTAGGNEKP